MITCPKCQNQLPDWSQTCQFCGAAVAKVPRQRTVDKPKYVRPGPPKYILVLYYLFAALWIVDGTRVLLVSLGAVPEFMAMGTLGQSFIGMASVVALLGVAFIALGLGLILKWEWARGVVNVVCWINILGGLLNLVGAIFTSPLGGLMGLFDVFLAMFSIAWTGAQIWVIGETD